MALSQDEQRMLAEIEKRLMAEDPSLASSLTTFRRPGPGSVLRSPRARIIGSLFTVLLVAMISLMVYAMIPLRAHMLRHTPPTATTAGVQATTAVSEATGTQPGRTQQPSASVSTGASTRVAQSAANRSAAPAASGKAQQAKVKPTGLAMLPETSP